MIKVTFFRADGIITGFESVGHAGYADSGYDIVCAAVSSLLITCANGLEKIAGIVPETQEKEEGGYLSIRLPEGTEEQLLHDAQIILSVTEMGIRDIAHDYPGYIRVSSRNRR